MKNPDEIKLHGGPLDGETVLIDKYTVSDGSGVLSVTLRVNDPDSGEVLYRSVGGGPFEFAKEGDG